MVLVDTSVWIDHLKSGNDKLKALLNEGRVVCHPFITGEIACVSLKNRNQVLALFQALPQLPVVDLEEYLYFIDANSLAARGIGFVDINLLASVRLSGCRIWTLDKKLYDISVSMSLAL